MTRSVLKYAFFGWYCCHGDKEVRDQPSGQFRCTKELVNNLLPSNLDSLCIAMNDLHSQTCVIVMHNM